MIGSEFEMLDSDQAAHLLNASVRTLWRMVEAGAFPPPVRFNRKLVRWDGGAVRRWLLARGFTCCPEQSPAGSLVRPPADLITSKQAAALLGVAESTIYRWRDEGKLKGYVVGGSRYRFRRADVLALVVEVGLEAPALLEAAS